MGNPDGAKNAILGIMTTSRLFKNLFFFPIESIVLTLFLKVLLPSLWGDKAETLVTLLGSYGSQGAEQTDTLEMKKKVIIGIF